MRVLAFSDFGPPERSGGVERVIHETYRRIVDAPDVAVDLLTLAPAKLPSTEVIDGIRVFRARRIGLEGVTGVQAEVSPTAIGRGLALAARTRPDVIHAHTLFFHTSLIALATARWRQVPLVITIHVGSTSALPEPQRSIARAYELTIGRRLLRSARRVIAVSEGVREHVLNLEPSADVTVIPNGVDTDQYRPRPPRGDSSTIRLISVGRLMPNKGQAQLISAVASASREANLELALVGDGPSRGALMRQAEQLGVDHIVTFLGHRDDVAELLRESDVFVRPSLSEGMSLAVLEAMASGLPCIVSDATGMRELIDHGVHGEVVPAGNIEVLTSAITRMRGSSLPRMGAEARKRAMEFSWDRVSSRTKGELERAIT